MKSFEKSEANQKKFQTNTPVLVEKKLKEASKSPPGKKTPAEYRLPLNSLPLKYQMASKNKTMNISGIKMLNADLNELHTPKTQRRESPKI